MGKRRHDLCGILPALPGYQAQVRTAVAVHHRLRHAAHQPARCEPLPYRAFRRRTCPLGYFRGECRTARLPLPGCETGYLSLPDLRRRGGDDRFRPADRQPEELPARRRRADRYLRDVPRRLRPGLHARAGRFHRYHRRCGRPDGHLPHLDARPRTAGPDRCGGLLLHGARAGDPAAYHARADQQEGAWHQDAYAAPGFEAGAYPLPADHRRDHLAAAAQCGPVGRVPHAG